MVHILGYFLAAKRNELTIHATIWMNDVKHYARPKKPYPKGYILYKSFQVLERQTHRARNPFSGSQELGKKLTTEGPEETFWSDLKNVLYHNCGGGYTAV